MERFRQGEFAPFVFAQAVASGDPGGLELGVGLPVHQRVGIDDELGAAVGWQVHSVRGFIAGTLKKRSDLTVLTERKDGVTRYRVVDNAPVVA